MSDKTALLKKIDELEGLNPDEKAQLKELLNNKKKYGLVWEDKPEKVESQLLDQLPVLKEIDERRIKAKPEIPEKGLRTKKQTLGLDFGTSESSSEDVHSLHSVELERTAPHHILIEGDNLHALTALSFTHKEKIDVIYIDPPYNTGNKDFKYNDSFVDKEDSYRHSKWLSFMHKRLKLAKQLLKDTGVIFISIDDNEQAQLKLLCDSVFGEENFVASVIWKRRSSSNMADHKLSSDHEYILMVKKAGFQSVKGIEKDYSQFKNPDSHPRGEYVLGDLTVGMTKDMRPNQFYDLVDSKTGKVYKPNPSRVWSYIPSSMERLILEGRIFFPESVSKRPMLRRFKADLKSEFNVITSLIHSYEFIGSNSEATRQIQEIFDFSIATYPKPLSILKFLIDQTSKEKSTILDFFAGSGTTLHATMQLNAEDGGHRQCILVTNNENNIAEKVCYERNKRVIQGYTKPNGEFVSGLSNNHLHYFKASFVPMNPHVDADSKAYVGSMEIRRRITEESLGMLCIKENCFEKVPSGFPFIKHFKSEEAHLILITNDMELESAIEYISALSQPSLANETEYIRVYVFSPNSYAYESDFESLGQQIKLCALPEAILNAYRHVRNDLELETRDLTVKESLGSVSSTNEEAENVD